eukprot:TRINITY_DN1344_c0_g1_i1.p1 TRINITY_DN1344_c0_g1~~TRINITY_DN1344_c0_g1_i1.p1  ORF type:complete len:252 (+),score=80.36 TRINITY_DN1344_c0_g1_i1:84-839(+)
MSTLMSPEDVQQHLDNNAAMREIYEQAGEMKQDTVIANRSFLDVVIGPRPWSEFFDRSARLRPHESRVLKDHYDAFYPFQGTVRVIGTAWLFGMVFGGVQGFYEGLARRSTRSWKIASQSLNSFSRTKGPLRANQYGMIATTFGVWETLIRYCVLQNERTLAAGEAGLLFGRVGSIKPEERRIWQKDSRLVAPAAGALAAFTVRSLKGGAGSKPGVIATNMAIASCVAYVYAHLWSKEDYFDFDKPVMEMF